MSQLSCNCLPPPNLFTQLLQYPSCPLKITLLQIHLSTQPGPKPPSMRKNRQKRPISIHHGILHPPADTQRIIRLQGATHPLLPNSSRRVILPPVLYRNRQSYRRHPALSKQTLPPIRNSRLLHNFCPQRCCDNLGGLVGELV